MTTPDVNDEQQQRPQHTQRTSPTAKSKGRNTGTSGMGNAGLASLATPGHILSHSVRRCARAPGAMVIRSVKRVCKGFSLLISLFGAVYIGLDGGDSENAQLLAVTIDDTEKRYQECK